MAELKVIDKIVAIVKASWPEGIVFDDENEVWQPPEELGPDDRLRPFIVVKFPHSTADPVSIGDPGNNWHREEGAAVIEMRIERGIKARAGREVCARIAGALRSKDLGDGVQTWAPTSPLRDDRNAEGVYYSLIFAVPYWCDIRG